MPQALTPEQEDHLTILTDYYKDIEQVSQSTLKHRVLGIKPPKKTFQPVEGNPVHQGSLLDCFLFTDYRLEEDFMVSKMEKKPSGKAVDVVVKLYERNLEERESDPDVFGRPFGDFVDLIEEYCTEVDLHQNWKQEARLKAVYKAWPYYESLVEAIGRAIVSETEYNDTLRGAQLVKLDPKYHELVLSKANDSRYVVAYQVAVRTYIDGVACRGLLDIVILDTVKRAITFYDLKRTTRTKAQFAYQARELRYDFQLAFYRELLRESSWLQLPGERDIDIKDWKVNCGGLIVLFADGEDSELEYIPVTRRDLFIGENGFVRKQAIEVTDQHGASKITENTSKVYGFREALKLYHEGLSVWSGKDFEIWT